MLLDILRAESQSNYRRFPNGYCGSRYASLQGFVLENGRDWPNQPWPKGKRGGGHGACFANATRLARRDRSMIYVEGYALRNDDHHLHHHLHAWCVDERGFVIDPTWKNHGVAYFGIPFDTKYLLAEIKKRVIGGDEYYGLIDDWQQGHPLLFQPAESFLAKQ